MATASDYINAAARYIGVSGTDNIFNTWIWGRHVYNPDTYPWCAAFQSYVGVHDLGMPFNPSASAAGVAWQGTRIDDSEVQPGDWVLFNWDGRQDFGRADHIGLVEWFDHSSGYFGTIEGNTGGGEGCVMRCTRYNYGGYATAFFRPPYDGSSSGGGSYDYDDYDYDDEEDEMSVWGYRNEDINGSKDAYALLTEIHRAVDGNAAGSGYEHVASLTYKNQRVNGTKDVYALLTEMHKNIATINKRLAKLEKK